MLEYKDFLIIGHPRGGTTYTSKLFKTFGFDVEHESIGASGTASWLFSHHNGWNYWTDKRKRNEFYFKWTILNIRNPLSIITSLIKENQSTSDSIRLVEQWTESNLKSITDPLNQAIERYLIWDKFLWDNNNIDFWFRVEDQQREVYNHLKFLGYNPYYHLGEKKINPHIIPRNINTRPKKIQNITLDDIPNRYKHKIIERMEFYGYSLES
jgi:hypothetical protein